MACSHNPASAPSSGGPDLLQIRCDTLLPLPRQQSVSWRVVLSSGQPIFAARVKVEARPELGETAGGVPLMFLPRFARAQSTQRASFWQDNRNNLPVARKHVIRALGHPRA